MSEETTLVAEVGASAVQYDYQAHIYEDERCIFCNVNALDDSIYGPFDCIERGQFVYTSETPGSGLSGPTREGTPL